MAKMHRWDYTCNGTDYVGLDEEKETEGVCDGSTFYAVDTKKLYVFYHEEWYEV